MSDDVGQIVRESAMPAAIATVPWELLESIVVARAGDAVPAGRMSLGVDIAP